MTAGVFDRADVGFSNVFGRVRGSGRRFDAVAEGPAAVLAATRTLSPERLVAVEDNGTLPAAQRIRADEALHAAGRTGQLRQVVEQSRDLAEYRGAEQMLLDACSALLVSDRLSARDLALLTAAAREHLHLPELEAFAHPARLSLIERFSAWRRRRRGL